MAYFRATYSGNDGASSAGDHTVKNTKKKGASAAPAGAGGATAAAPAATPAAAASKAAVDSRVPEDISRLDLRVGKIVKVWNHPKADKLFCEEVSGDDGVEVLGGGRALL